MALDQSCRLPGTNFQLTELEHLGAGFAVGLYVVNGVVDHDFLMFVLGGFQSHSEFQRIAHGNIRADKFQGF